MPSIRPEPRWPASTALVTCAVLYVVLPNRLVVGPRWLLPALIVLPLIPLSITKHRHPDESQWVRRFSITLIAIVTLANMISMSLLVRQLLVAHVSQGRNLVYSAVAVWFTNIISFGLWFWEIDRGGPHLRAGGTAGLPDIQFPQMENPTLAPPNWHPRFFDYLYTSFANGTSFAPADAMPLSLRVKVLFLSESIVSFVTVAIVAARAVNILK
jgi:uncharacterized membrane protein